MQTTEKKITVLRPYQTFEGVIRYRKVTETRQVPVTLSVVITR